MEAYQDGQIINIGREFEYIYTGAVNQKIVEILAFNSAHAYLDLTEQQCFQLFSMALKPKQNGQRLSYDEFLNIPKSLFDEIKKNLWDVERNAKLLNEYSKNVKAFNDLLISQNP